MEKLSYALGMVIGHNLKDMNVSNLNTTDFAQAVADVMSGTDTQLTAAEAQQIVQKFLQEAQEEASNVARSEEKPSWPKMPRRRMLSFCPADCNIR